MRKQLKVVGALTLLGVLSVSMPALAQSATSGTIAGTVRDSSGAVLPGATVEASSAVLIERTRSVATDEQGQYKIVDLRPGTYVVTFSLQGFSSVKREGIELNTGFTANVSAELNVGSINETLTVTGATPIIDVQNARSQTVYNHEALDAVPTGKTFTAFITLTPGVSGAANGGVATRDVGGTQGEFPLGLRSHGSDAGLTSIDGIKTISTTGGDWRRLNVTDLYTQETVLETSGGNAEAWSGGVNVNVVPREGGNAFHGVIQAIGTGKGFDSNNLDASLQSRGLTTYNQQKKMWDFGGSIGGPIVKDRVWFFATPRKWGNEFYVAGNYYSSTPHTLFYNPDFSRPAIYRRDQWDFSGRVTIQATAKDKLTISSNNGYQCFCPFAVEGGTVSPEGAAVYYYDPQRLVTVAWTHPATSRLLFDGAIAWRNEGVRSDRPDPSLSTASDIAVFETSLGRNYGSQFATLGPTDYGLTPSQHWLGRGSMSFITGSQALKVGFTFLREFGTLAEQPNFPYEYTFTNQRPVSITEVAAPYSQTTYGFMYGLYAQDQLTLRRLTINAGLRFDAIRQWSPAQSYAQGLFQNAVNFPQVDNIPNWKDINPRIGAAFDLFGNGKTALKGSFGRYELSNSFSLAFGRNNSPLNTLVRSVTRTWNDANGNFVPDCDLTNPRTNGECGPINNSAFGTTVTPNTVYDPSIKTGWGNSPHLWEGSVSVQHQLATRVAVNVGYFRTWYGNIYDTDNTLVNPSDFSSYCVTAPMDPRLPSGGGYPVCGLYDVNPNKFGQVQNVIKLQPGRSQVFNGIDATVNARFTRGASLAGGVSTGQNVTDNCAAFDVPNSSTNAISGTIPSGANAPYCHQTVPWGANTEFKFNGVYPLPWYGLQASATYLNLPGLTRNANAVFTNSQIAPSLGRNLAACPPAGPCNATVIVNLLTPFTQFEPRGQQLDARVSKIFKFGTMRFQANVDAYNLTNSNDVISLNNAFGGTWLKPVSIIPGRLWKFGGQLTF